MIVLHLSYPYAFVCIVPSNCWNMCSGLYYILPWLSAFFSAFTVEWNIQILQLLTKHPSSAYTLWELTELALMVSTFLQMSIFYGLKYWTWDFCALPEVQSGHRGAPQTQEWLCPVPRLLLEALLRGQAQEFPTPPGGSPPSELYPALLKNW